MNVLITGAASPLGQQIVAELASSHQLRLLDNTTPDIKYENLEFIHGSLVDPSIANEATQNIDVLIHTGEPLQNLPQDPLKCEQVLLDLPHGVHTYFSKPQLTRESNASSTAVHLKFLAAILMILTSANFTNRCRHRKSIKWLAI